MTTQTMKTCGVTHQIHRHCNARKLERTLKFLRRPAIRLRGGATHEHGSFTGVQPVSFQERLDGLLVMTTGKARVQSVPHRQRSKPQASNMRPSGSQIFGNGYGSFDSVQAPVILITAFLRLASSRTLGRSAQGCGGAGGSVIDRARLIWSASRGLPICGSRQRSEKCGAWCATRRRFPNGRSVQARGYRRFRCRACGKQFNERSGGILNRAQYPSDVIALVVFWRLRYKLSLRDLPEMFLIRGIEFSYEAVRDWEAKLTPSLIDSLRRRRKGRIGRSW